MNGEAEDWGAEDGRAEDVKPPVIDPEDNQHDAAVISDLVKVENFHKFPCVAIIGGHVLTNTLEYSSIIPTTRCCLWYPPHQRSHVLLYYHVPRDMAKEHNPDRECIHTIQISCPARKIPQPLSCKNVNSSDLSNTPLEGTKLHGDLSYHYIKLNTQDAIVSGANLPKLKDDTTQNNVQSIISVLMSRRDKQGSDGIPITILVEGDKFLAPVEVANFNKTVTQEKDKDPLMDFYSLTPGRKVLQMGSIVEFAARPDIPVQPARLVFEDGVEYQVPHIMGATYEMEFKSFAMRDYTRETFKSKWVSLSISKHNDDALPNAYLVFVSKAGIDLENLQPGDQVEIALPNYHNNEQAMLKPVQSVSLLEGSIKQPGKFVKQDDEDQNELFGTLLRYKGPMPTLEEDDKVTTKHDDEDILRFFGTDRDDEFGDDDEDLSKPNVWRGVVISTILCPSSYFGILVSRPRDPCWEGEKKDRPFVNTKVPCISDKARSTDELKTQIENLADSVTILIKPVQDIQSYKDDLRSMTALFHSNEKDKITLREYILGRWDPTVAETTTSILEDMGPIDNLGDFSKSQQEMYRALGKLKRKIALVHGPFGTGKTSAMIKIIAKYISNPQKHQRVLYVTGTNVAVDDAAQRCRAECEKQGLCKVIIRAHSLKGERARLVKTTKGKPRFTASIPENVVQEFYALAYTSKIAKEHDAKHCHGDPRRVLQDMSLTQAMLNYLEEHADNEPILRSLRASLHVIDKRGSEKFDLKELRAKINILMKLTLANADVIFCTINTASKVNLYQNFPACLIACDEGCRATEISTTCLMAFYNPDAWIFIGDHMQMRPIVLSADREKKYYRIRFQNTFHRQLLLSFMHRLLALGHPVSFLSEQHRCDGGSAYFASQTFYNGRVIDATPQPHHEAVIEARNYAERLGLRDGGGANMAIMDVCRSRSFKPEGSMSTVNPDHVSATITAVLDALHNPKLLNKAGKPVGVTISAMYKDQVALYVSAVEKLEKSNQERITVRTVDSMQGYEDDFVFLDMVRSSGVGFTGQRNRLNVALTRHRLLLIVVMNLDMIPQSIEHPTRHPATEYIAKLINEHKIRHLIIKRRADSNVPECKKCGQRGHLKRDCTMPKKTSNSCHNCGQTGHFSRDCLLPKVPTCRFCNLRGHMKADCPEKVKLTCILCKEKGHEYRCCPFKGQRLGLKAAHKLKYGVLEGNVEMFTTNGGRAKTSNPIAAATPTYVDDTLNAWEDNVDKTATTEANAKISWGGIEDY
jgi:hypothetical protein